MNNDFLETYQQTFGAELVVKSSADGYVYCLFALSGLNNVPTTEI